jgi:hypothetical protein
VVWLHIACTVASIWIPLAARLTAANEADNIVAPHLIHELPLEVRYVLGDTHYNDPNLRIQCERDGRCLVATRRGSHPHEDEGAKVRQVFHVLRTKAIEPFNGLFKNIFEWGGQVSTKGLKKTQLIVLGAVLVYQLILLYQFEHRLPLGQTIKPFLRAA